MVFDDLVDFGFYMFVCIRTTIISSIHLEEGRRDIKRVTKQNVNEDVVRTTSNLFSCKSNDKLGNDNGETGNAPTKETRRRSKTRR